MKYFTITTYSKNAAKTHYYETLEAAKLAANEIFKATKVVVSIEVQL